MRGRLRKPCPVALRLQALALNSSLAGFRMGEALFQLGNTHATAYQKAANTGDDAYGAQAEAQKYIAEPFRKGGK